MLCFPSNDLKSNITFFLLRCFLSPALLTVTVVPHAASLLSMKIRTPGELKKKKKSTSNVLISRESALLPYTRISAPLGLESCTITTFF